MLDYIYQAMKTKRINAEKNCFCTFWLPGQKALTAGGMAIAQTSII